MVLLGLRGHLLCSLINRLRAVRQAGNLLAFRGVLGSAGNPITNGYKRKKAGRYMKAAGKMLNSCKLLRKVANW